MQVVLGGIILLLALVGFWFIAMLIWDLISGWWHDRKKRLAFENAELRIEAIKEAKLEVLHNIREYCRHSRIMCDMHDESMLNSGILNGIDVIAKYVNEYYDVIKESKV